MRNVKFSFITGVLRIFCSRVEYSESLSLREGYSESLSSWEEYSESCKVDLEFSVVDLSVLFSKIRDFKLLILYKYPRFLKNSVTGLFFENSKVTLLFF